MGLEDLSYHEDGPMISVLYVDDESVFLDLGKQFLERSGKIRVDTFSSAEIAMKILDLNHYDAIISDYQMPGMNGIEFLSFVRKTQPNVPFIVYTGQGREEIAISALNHGADLYLQKGGSPRLQFGEIENFIKNIVAREDQKGQILSEKRKAEDALSLLQTLYEYAPFGFAFINTEQIFIHANDAFAEINGALRIQLLGRKMPETTPGMWEQVADQIRMVQNSGRPVLNHHVSDISLFETGAIRDWLMSFYPVFSKDEKLMGIGILVIDNTERYAIEHALSESEERYRTLAESAQDIIFIITNDLNISYINRYGCQLLLAKTECLIGQSIKDPHIRIEKLIPEDAIRQVLKSGEKYSYDTGFTANDQYRWFEVLLIPMLGATVGSEQVMGIGRDITRRKRAESGLLNANKKLNLLSGITRHDIINQLSFLFLSLDRFKSNIQSDASADDLYTQIYQSVKTIHHQIEFTREYQEIGIAAPIWQNLHDVITRSIKMLPMKNVTYEYSNTEVEIFADSLFEKVVYNLIENALRYGETLTTITWRIEYHDTIMNLIIEDDGIGIPEEEKEQIFSFGYGQHTGFGLFMAKEILSITNMTINETGIPGKGAQFVIEIPSGYFRISVSSE